MIEEYSIMDWITFSGIVATIASLVGIAIKLARDNSGLKAEMKALSKEREMEHDRLSPSINRVEPLLGYSIHGIQTHGFPLSRSTCYQEVRHLAKVEDEHFVRDRLAECHR